MATSRTWSTYPATFRAKETKTLAKWIEAGDSGAVVGLNGSGKSNLFSFLCHRPEVFKAYLSAKARPVVLVPVDLNDLPATDLSSFFRVILRSFFEIRQYVDQPTQQTVVDIYQINRTATDPFLPQSALRELLFYFQAQQTCVVFLIDGFDSFTESATPQMFNTLRGLRDTFKDTLCYIMGMRQEVAYLPKPEILGELYELLDTQVCWVGPMTEEDSRHAIASLTYTATASPVETDIKAILALTGGYPALLKTVCHWWLEPANRPPPHEWSRHLLTKRSVIYRLEEIWRGLSQEEQLVLAELQKLELQIKPPPVRNLQITVRKQKERSNALAELEKQHPEVLTNLTAKGLCYRPKQVSPAPEDRPPTGLIFCRLLADFIAEVGDRSRGKIWQDRVTGDFFQDQTRLDVQAPKEQAILTFLVGHPRVRHTYTDLMEQGWSFEELYGEQEAVSTDNLFQVIKKLRKRIEPDSSHPRYIINWRGKPEGGYQFFPEGRPG